MKRIDRAIATRVALLLGLLVWLLPAGLFAAEAEQAAARALFAEGRQLAASGNYEQACAKFEDSYRLNPGIGTNFNLADCLEHLGRTAGAWARFLDVATATKAAGQPERESVARARAAALEPSLSRLVVDVRSPAAGLIVQLDHIRVAETSWGMALPADPGEHVIEAVAPKKKKWSTRVTVPPTAETLSVSVPQLEDAPTEPPPPETPPALLTLKASHPKEPARWTVPIVSLGSLGVAGLVTGAVFALSYLSANDEAKTLCPSPMNVCQNPGQETQHQTLVADAYRDRALAFVGAGIGGAALATAAFLWWRRAHRPQTTAAPTTLRVSPTPAGSLVGWGANLEVRW
jgi:tetratricopeptide (TPR) repeat protein